jgi:hypothetical protein
MNYDKVEDTFFEAFQGKYVRALITGPTEKIVKRAAYDSTSTPSAVIGRVEGGVEGFFQNEVLPYAPDSILDPLSIETGYELSFTKYFYKPKGLRTINEISSDIRDIEERTDGLLNEILGK